MQRVLIQFHLFVVGNSLVIKYATHIETARRLCHGGSRSL